MRKSVVEILTGVLAGTLAHCGSPPASTAPTSSSKVPPPQDSSAQDAGAAADPCAAYIVTRSATVALDEKQMCDLLGPDPAFAVPIGPHGTQPGACQRLCKDAAFEACQVPLATFDQYRIRRVGQATCPSGYLAGGTAQLTCEVRVANPGYRGPSACPTPVGRPPAGFAATAQQSEDAAEWLAHAAEVEAASVDGFLAARDALARFGAPADLVRRCEVAAHDEARHASLVGDLAERRGRAAPTPAPHAATTPSLLAFAIENAATGVVRETFGALLTLHQAATARDADVRDAMRTIAREECAHAALGFAIDEWLDAQLDPAARAEVAAARRSAVRDLDDAIARGAMALPRELGMPPRAIALRMLAAVDAALWATA